MYYPPPSGISTHLLRYILAARPTRGMFGDGPRLPSGGSSALEPLGHELVCPRNSFRNILLCVPVGPPGGVIGVYGEA